MNQSFRLFGFSATVAFALFIGQLALAQGNGPTGLVNDSPYNRVRSDG